MISMPSAAALDAIAISIGAAGGALARYHIGKVSSDYIAKDPKTRGIWTAWHVAGINLSGSFVLGMLAGVPSSSVSPQSKLMVGVGFCGSFTTFSTYSMDLVTMANEGRFLKALSYFGVNNIGGFAAAAAGLTLMKTILKKV
jgi:CrcB protein